MGLSNFNMGPLLGKGSFGAVYRARRKSDNRDYAIKEINIQELNARERDDALNEIRILASVKHNNIVGYREAFLEGHHIYIVMDFAKNGDLHSRVKKLKARNRYFDEEHIWLAIIQILKGLKALHSQNILHRDLKPKNVFIAGAEHVQLGDLGCSKLLKRGLTRTQVGTPYYMSPELWKRKEYDAKSDTWAVGCIAFEMAALHPPFLGNDMRELSKRVCMQPAPTLPRRYSRELSDAVHRMLSKHPTHRPSVDELLAMEPIKQRLSAMEERGVVAKTPPSAAPAPRILSTIKAPKHFGRRPVSLRLPQSSYPTARLHTSPAKRGAARGGGSPSATTPARKPVTARSPAARKQQEQRPKSHRRLPTVGHPRGGGGGGGGHDGVAHAKRRLPVHLQPARGRGHKAQRPQEAPAGGRPVAPRRYPGKPRRLRGRTNL